MAGPNFNIIMRTGDAQGAGTNGDVYIKLIGDVQPYSQSESNEVSLDIADYDDFEKGSEDIYPVSLVKGSNYPI